MREREVSSACRLPPLLGVLSGSNEQEGWYRGNSVPLWGGFCLPTKKEVKMSEIELNLQTEQEKGLQNLAAISSLPELEAWKQTFLGKSSLVMTTFGKMGSFSKEERPLVGKAVNAVKVAFEAAFAEKEEVLKRDALLQSMESEKLDVSLPGRAVRRGRLHPINHIA